MKHRFALNLLILSCALLLLLSSCGPPHDEPITEGFTTSSSSSMASTENTIASSIFPSSVHTNPSPKGYGNVRHLEMEDDNRHTLLVLYANADIDEDCRLWTLYQAVAATKSTSGDEFTIPSYLDEFGHIPYVIANNISLSNFTHLIFDTGIEAIDFSVTNSPIGDIQEVTLPSTLHTLIGYPFEYDTESNTYYFEDNHYLLVASPLLMQNTFPNEKFPKLQKIHVDGDNPLFEDEDGILYQQNHLICIPQNYQTTDGTVTVREGTIDIYFGAAVECRNIKRLIIPDSVLNVNVRAIVATAEHPLTVVCSHGSAAAAYVAEFGEQYHLTVEYTD